MEVLREGGANPSHSSDRTLVSILVLMEVLREEHGHGRGFQRGLVSILVLMEVLREAADRPAKAGAT